MAAPLSRTRDEHEHELLPWNADAPHLSQSVFPVNLYGRPGLAYELQWTTNLSGPPWWQPGPSLTLTNPVSQLLWTNSGAPALFLRAREQ
jgi:hypothetical protein